VGQGVKVLGVVRVVGHELLRVLLGFFVVLVGLFRVDTDERGQRVALHVLLAVGLARVRLQRFLEGLDRVLELLLVLRSLLARTVLGLVGAAQVEPGLAEVGIEPSRSLVVVDRLLEVLFLVVLVAVFHGGLGTDPGTADPRAEHGNQGKSHDGRGGLHEPSLRKRLMVNGSRRLEDKNHSAAPGASQQHRREEAARLTLPGALLDWRLPPMIRFEDIYENVKRHHAGADLEVLRKAYIFSAVEHKGQTRASGEPYLVHPLEVAAILAELRMDPACVAVGLLHDVLEDTLTDADKIKEHFGPDVLHIVEGVTKISKIPFSSSEERQAENFRKLLLAMVDDVRVIIVKLADRLHNMRTLQYLPEERRTRIARETMDIYAPLAGRLGMSKIKNELEDLSFQYLEPESYRELMQRVEQRRTRAIEFIEKIKTTVSEKLQAAGLEATLEGRIKRLHSIYQKLRKQRIDIDQVYDFVALRIVVPTIPDCYAALGVLHNLWRPVPGRIKDFIAMPRPNGYRSLHTSVISDDGHPFEVQIRTREMHRVAEEGIAAHWKYKEGRSGPDKDDQAFAWMRQLLEWQQEVKDPHEFLNSLKLDLYPE